MNPYYDKVQSQPFLTFESLLTFKFANDFLNVMLEFEEGRTNLNYLKTNLTKITFFRDVKPHYFVQRRDHFRGNVFLQLLFVPAVPWLRQFVAGLSLRRPGLDSRPLRLRFVMIKVALELVSLQLRQSSLINIIHQCSIRMYSCNTECIISETESVVKWNASLPLSYSPHTHVTASWFLFCDK